jgi:hypothetical protein
MHEELKERIKEQAATISQQVADLLRLLTDGPGGNRATWRI